MEKNVPCSGYILFSKPSSQRDPKSITALAALLGRPIPEVRLLWASRFPKILGFYADLDEAVEGLEKITGVGFEGFIVEQARLKAPTAFITTSKVVPQPDQFIWQSLLGGGVSPVSPPEITCAFSDIQALLLGVSRTTSKIEQSQMIRRNISLPGANITVSTDQSRGSWTERDKKQLIFLKLASEPALLLVQETKFDFSFLGKEKTHSGALNLRAFLKYLRERCPGALYDERLIQFAGNSFGTGRSVNKEGDFTTETNRTSDFESVVEMARLLTIELGVD